MSHADAEPHLEAHATYLQNVSRHIKGRPQVLNGLEEGTRKYLKEVVEKLWKEEKEDTKERIEPC